MTLFSNLSRPVLKATVLTTMLGLLVGCQEIKDMAEVKPLNGVTYKLNFQPAPTLVEGMVVDAKTGSMLDVPVNVIIVGKDAGRTVDFAGRSITRYKTELGNFQIGVRGSVPTETAPAELRVLIEADGYVSSSVNLQLTQAINDPFTIQLVKKSDAPDGVAATTSTLTNNASGAILADQQIQVKSPAVGDSVPAMETRLQIAANTVMKDASGQPVTGNVTASLVAFSGESSAAMRVFPGGGNASIATDFNGSTDTRFPMKPGGFTAIKLTNGNGQTVATFSKPVWITMSIAPSAINPATTKPYAAGDTLMTYSYSDYTGEWTYEHKGIVEQQASGLVARFYTMHLTDFGWWGNIYDFFYYLFKTPSRPVYRNTYVTLPSLPDNYTYKFQSQSWWMKNASQDYAKSSRSKTLLLGTDVVGNKDYEVIISTTYGQTLYKGKIKACQNNVLTTVRFPARASVAFDIWGYCANNANTLIYPFANVWYKKPYESDSDYKYGCSLEFGKATMTDLEPNTDYSCRITYAGKANYFTVRTKATYGIYSQQIAIPATANLCQ